ncbi:MAG: VOC family protein [Sporolactobacillus sp.]|nr:VOC family protein [Sporolactobacillus sp.]
MSFHKRPHTYVSQVRLCVLNLERSQDFYVNMLGLRVLEKGERTIAFTANGTDPLITVEQPEGILPRQPHEAGLYHFALLLPSRKDLAAVLAHLLKDGWPLQGGADHAVSEAVYLADPDGNGIELYRDRPPKQWNWENGKVYMPTVGLDEQILHELDGQPWTGLPVQTMIGHIHLQVADLEAAATFYTKGLGFRLVANYGQMADFLSTGGYHHHIGLNIWESKGRPASGENRAGMKRFTIDYPSRQARSEALQRVRTMGTDVTEREGDIFVTDPSNLGIRLRVGKK